MSGFEVQKFTTLATAHLPGPDVLEHEAIAPWVFEYEFGWFVIVPGSGDDPDTVNEALTNSETELDINEVVLFLLRWARAEGLDLVRFDSDEGISGNLPRYDW